MFGKDYILVDVEKRARENPVTFRIPTVTDRKSLKKGDCAKLIFDDKERMWVVIDKRLPGGSYQGHLDSTPITTPLERGDEIVFKPHHVASIMTSNDLRRSLEKR